MLKPKTGNKLLEVSLKEQNVRDLNFQGLKKFSKSLKIFTLENIRLYGIWLTLLM